MGSNTKKKRRGICNSEQLYIGSKYFIFHIKMYVKTLLWLREHQVKPIEWDTFRNAIFEDHLVHARILINFLFIINPRENDVCASDYFYDMQDASLPRQDAFLSEQVRIIGSHLVHITTKSMPKMRSEEEWPTKEISEKLIPAIKEFLYGVPDNRLACGVKTQGLELLSEVIFPEIPVSFSRSS
jgi:hypothetical protein